MLGAIGWIASDGTEFTRRMARTQPGCPGYLGPARQARRLQPRPAQPGIGKTDTRRNNLCPRRPPHSREMYGGQISYDLRRLRAHQIIPPGRPRLQGSHRRPRQPGLTRHPATTRHQAPLTSGISRNTQPKLTQPVKSLRGKITYALSRNIANGCGNRQFGLVIQIVGAPNLTPNICVEVISERTAGARTEHRVMGGWPGL